MSENLVVNACLRYLLNSGYFVWRNNTGAYPVNGKGGKKRFIRYGYKGSPDIIGMTPEGKFIGVECKFGYNKLSDSQKVFKQRCEDSRGVFIVAYSVDELIDKLKDL